MQYPKYPAPRIKHSKLIDVGEFRVNRDRERRKQAIKRILDRAQSLPWPPEYPNENSE